MMPEQLEKQLKPQEIADLFAFLSLDKPPGDPSATCWTLVRSAANGDSQARSTFSHSYARIIRRFLNIIQSTF